MPHGDDVYTTIMYAAPASELLVEESFYTNPSNIIACDADAGCLGDRHRAMVAMDYPAKYVIERCCDPSKYNYAACTVYTTNDFSPQLTAAEIASFETILRPYCPL